MLTGGWRHVSEWLESRSAKARYQAYVIRHQTVILVTLLDIELEYGIPVRHHLVSDFVGQFIGVAEDTFVRGALLTGIDNPRIRIDAFEKT